MKHSDCVFSMKRLFLFFFLAFFGLMVSAQGDQTGGGSSESNTTTTTKKTNVSITGNDNTGNNAWYSSPWVWVVGAAVFILLLVALLSNRGRDTVTTSDRVKVTKTVERDSGSDV